MNKLQSKQRKSKIYTYVINNKREEILNQSDHSICVGKESLLIRLHHGNPTPPRTPLRELMTVCVFCPQAGPSL